MKTIFCLAATLAPLAAAPPEADGQITLPYSEFARLTTPPEKPAPPPAPPVPSALTRADYLITIGTDGRATVRAEWQAENFTEFWQSVAVAPLDLAIEPDAESALVVSDGVIRMLMPTRGIHRAAATFPAATGLGVAARFPIAPAAFTSVRIEGENPTTHTLDGASTLVDADGRIRHLLPANVAEVIVRRAEAPADPEKPETWNVTAEAWITYDAGWLDHEVRLTATPAGRGSAAMQLAFPNMPARIMVTSDDLAGYEPTVDGLLIQWESRATRERTLTLRYRNQLMGEPNAWLPQLPETTGTTMVLAIPQGAEISGEGWLPDPPPARLPAWLREKSRSGPVLLHPGTPKPVSVKWLPRVETDSMTIAEANINTRVVADGSQLTTAIYQVVHDAPGTARWSLPPNMKLLDVVVGGRRTTAVDRGDALEFALPAPAEGKPTHVSFSYTGTGAALDRVAGGLAVESPSTPLFAHRIDWQILLPDGTLLDAVESNAGPAPAPANAPTSAAFLRRQLTRGEPLRAEVFYSSRHSEN